MPVGSATTAPEQLYISNNGIDWMPYDNPPEIVRSYEQLFRGHSFKVCHGRSGIGDGIHRSSYPTLTMYDLKTYPSNQLHFSGRNGHSRFGYSVHVAHGVPDGVVFNRYGLANPRTRYEVFMTINYLPKKNDRVTYESDV
jgi:hypothetical protein